MIHRAFLVSLLAFAVAGCGSSASSICSDVCDCTGCSEDEEAECIDSVEDQQKAASDEGCDDPYDALLSCYGEQLECRDSKLDVDGCDSEEEELTKCAGPGLAGVGGSACDRAAAICSAETGQGTGSSGGECSSGVACASRCIVDAGSCDFNDEALLQCVSDCNGSATGPGGGE